MSASAHTLLRSILRSIRNNCNDRLINKTQLSIALPLPLPDNTDLVPIIQDNTKHVLEDSKEIEALK